MSRSQEPEEKVRSTIMQLSEIADLIGLRQHIIDGTNKGRKLHADPWHNTRDYMQHYADPANTEQAMDLFKDAGCRDELEALRWLLRHDELVP